MIFEQFCIRKFVFFVCFLATVESYHPRFTYKRDAEENEHHILNILKDHDIIPDIIDDATHTDILEVSVNMVLKKKMQNSTNVTYVKGHL